jgi:hypothetical protein
MESLIIFVIFIVFSLLRSLGGQQPQKQPGRPGVPPGPPLPRPVRPVRPVPPLARPETVPGGFYPLEFEAVPSTAWPEAEPSVDICPEAPPVREERPPACEATGAWESSLLQMDGEALLQGVVFAEILGPPRSRRRWQYR